jgi:hypothetical protein
MGERINRIRRGGLTKGAVAATLLLLGARTGRSEDGDAPAAESTVSVTRFRVKPGLGADQTAKIQGAIDYCSAHGVTQLLWPMSSGQVYSVDGVINARQVAFIGTGGPLASPASGYTFDESQLRSCIYLRGRGAQIVDLTFAEGLSIVCNRTVHRVHAVVHRRRLQWHSQNFGLYHAGADGLHFPHGCIHWYFGQASEIVRARQFGVYLADQDDGTRAPDTDSNIIVCDGGRLLYNRQGNFYFKGSGGVFDFHGGFDLTKAGEPDESGKPAVEAFAVTLRIVKGTNSTAFSFRDGWLEKNCNLFDIAGTIKNISMERLRITAYDGVPGVMFRLAGYVYNLHARQIGFSGPRYAHLFDASQWQQDGAAVNNGIRIDATVEGYLRPCDHTVANNLRFLRAIGGFMLQTFPAGTIRSVAASGDTPGHARYLVDPSRLGPGTVMRPVALQPAWYFNHDQARDISLFVGGHYAGEVRDATETSWETDRGSIIGDGSVAFYVRQKLQTEPAFPKAYSQSALLGP